jgi:predicted DNA-binding protein
MAVKIKLEDDLYERVKKIASVAGYATPEEFITHVIEKELTTLEAADSDEAVTERLRGLGYLE